jgi:hypothetical protein
MVTKGIRGVVTTAMLALAVAALWPAAQARAQQPIPASTIFEMTGFIQQATLDNPGDAFSGGTLTMNNHVVVIPRNTIFQMPATNLTWAELFTQAPAPWGIGSGPQGEAQTGLALNDTPKPAYTNEVTVQGNRVVEGGKDRYIAALVFISNLSVQQHQGFISAIDYVNGELILAGARVRLNDPVGRFGRAMTHDKRFTIDEDNPTVKSETGYPMCLPRTRVDQGVDDPLCPQGNRPAGQSIFTMGTPPAPTAAERQNPALRRQTAPSLDPWRAAPFKVGDYVTVIGPIVKDAAGQYISAHTITANVGIFTAPGTQPAYVAIDVVLMGTGPLADATLAQEGAKRTRVEGFTTDFTSPVMISAVDVNACTGEGVDRLWNVEAIDPGPPNGAVAGRWRFRPGAPLFDLKGFPFLPPTREVHVVSFSGTVTTLNGLSAGEYTAPNFEFILPENRGIGSPIVPGNFETMAFLTQGSGPRGGAYTGQLDPWPGEAASKPVRNACAVVSSDLSVKSGSLVTLDGSQSVAANVPTGPVTYKWSQISGTTVALTNAATPTATFTAPTVAVGSTTALAFKLTTTPTNGGAAVDSRFLTVTVVNPDVTAPTVAAPTTGTTLKPGSTLTLNTTATDNVAVSSVTFIYSYTASGVKQTKTVAGVKSTTIANTWTASFIPTVSGSYTFTAVASDAAGNQTTSGATVKTVQ